MIFGHLVTLWITFGGLTVEKSPTEILPLSVSSCTNESFSEHIYRLDKSWPKPLLVHDWITNDTTEAVRSTTEFFHTDWEPPRYVYCDYLLFKTKRT